MNLIEEFYLNKVKQDELEMVFLTYFGRGEGPSDNKSTYRKEGEGSCFVIISYNDKGDISSIDGGPGLAKNHIEEIKKKIVNELISNQDELIGRDICFIVGEKNDGYFSYRNKFQILPLPADAPQIKNQLYGYHPILFPSVQNGRDIERLVFVVVLLAQRQ